MTARIARDRMARDGGFALVEALASLVIVGMISAMLFAGVTTGRRVWERMDVREASGEAIDTAQTVLRDRLEQTYPLPLYQAIPPRIDFSGDPARLTFLANPAEAGRPAPLRRYDLWLDATGALRLSSRPDAGPGADGPWAEEVLMTGARGLDIAYFGARADSRRQWWTGWRDQAALPDLVRIRLVFASGDRRDWPDLLVHPRATIDTACLLNTLTHRCKGRL